MASIIERKTATGDTRYLVTVRLKGHPTQCATFDRKTDAKLWAEDIQADIRRGRHFHAAEAKKRTLADLIDRYLEEGFQQKPSSLYKQKLNLQWWRAELGDYLLAHITPAKIAAAKSKLLREKTHRFEPITKHLPPKGRIRMKRSPATVNRFLAALSDAFTDAVKEWHWIDQNPVLQVKKLQEPRGRTRFLNDEERIALLSACKDSRSPELYLVVLTALTTGARRGEITGLRWSDVNLDRSLLILSNTKNGDTRSVPLTQETWSLYLARSKVRRIDTDFVFPSHSGKRPIDVSRAFEEAMKRANIENFRFHDLRHTAASYLAMSGATLPELAAVLGHRTLAMVKRYTHLTEQHTAAVLTKMTAKYFA